MAKAPGVWPRLGLLAMVLCIILLLTASRNRPPSGSDGGVAEPQYSVEEGTEFIWQRPRNPKAVLFLAHGCSHSATDWWNKSRACPKCIGLPVEMRIVRAALAAGYVAVAVSSQDRAFSRCWTEDDLEPVKRVIGSVVRKIGAKDLPVFALGASSGGAFLPMLTQTMHLSALAVQIMATSTALLTPQFPPTAFIHMPRDGRTARHVEANVLALNRSGVPAHNWPQPPLRVSARFFSDYVDSIGLQLSDRIFKALKDADYLDDRDELKADPRHSGWREVLKSAISELRDVSMAPDESPLSEVMNLAYAAHEITDVYMRETLKFFDEVLTRNAGPRVAGASRF
eukprot:GGOE01036625.1.p1 GENE.GGOE01036625.1~~GGOE01036625.1.p1  ORF type:complete len:359 (+),score=68.82 GGOE01036625.1:57-1079(+)